MHERFAELLAQMADEARGAEMDLDTEVYRGVGRDPFTPILLGTGSLEARVGFFGRDPGRTEVFVGEPFVGKGGQLVRRELFRATGKSGEPTMEESIAAGRPYFWGNTVPFKPVGNKAWSTRVKRRFAPFIAAILTECWQGNQLITLGNDAFHWFGLTEPANRDRLSEFWRRDDRYQSSITVTLNGKGITLYPLPHPSPLNATWFKHFPEMLRARLDELGVGT